MRPLGSRLAVTVAAERIAITVRVTLTQGLAFDSVPTLRTHTGAIGSFEAWRALTRTGDMMTLVLARPALTTATGLCTV